MSDKQVKVYVPHYYGILGVFYSYDAAIDAYVKAAIHADKSRGMPEIPERTAGFRLYAKQLIVETVLYE
jgi:hypothetical protein